MIGLGFLMRVGQFLFYIAIAVIVILVVIWIVNKSIQFIADWFGWNVTDFWVWLKSKRPARKSK